MAASTFLYPCCKHASPKDFKLSTASWLALTWGSIPGKSSARPSHPFCFYNTTSATLLFSTYNNSRERDICVFHRSASQRQNPPFPPTSSLNNRRASIHQSDLINTENRQQQEQYQLGSNNGPNPVTRTATMVIGACESLPAFGSSLRTRRRSLHAHRPHSNLSTCCAPERSGSSFDTVNTNAQRYESSKILLHLQQEKFYKKIRAPPYRRTITQGEVEKQATATSRDSRASFDSDEFEAIDHHPAYLRAALDKMAADKKQSFFSMFALSLSHPAFQENPIKHN